jgi:hypothetical protein
MQTQRGDRQACKHTRTWKNKQDGRERQYVADTWSENIGVWGASRVSEDLAA